jgi:hypothetical protein
MLAFKGLLIGVIFDIPDNSHYDDLRKSWKAIIRACNNALDCPKAPTVHVVLGEPPACEPPLQCSAWWL